jgi:hypothetical protein
MAAKVSFRRCLLRRIRPDHDSNNQWSVCIVYGGCYTSSEEAVSSAVCRRMRYVCVHRDLADGKRIGCLERALHLCGSGQVAAEEGNAEKKKAASKMPALRKPQVVESPVVRLPGAHVVRRCVVGAQPRLSTLQTPVGSEKARGLFRSKSREGKNRSLRA